MRLVTILVPAYKPEHLYTTLASIDAQTYPRIKVIVGNHSPNENDHHMINDMAQRYDFEVINTHLICPGDQVAHYAYLWDQADSDLVRFVYDDDVIYPSSTSYLVDLADHHRDAVMFWHQRHWIDGAGRFLRAPGFINQDELMKSSRENILRLMAMHKNFIGEPSFVMMDRSKCAFTMTYAPLGELAPRHYLGDVTSYLEATRHGPAVGGGAHLGAFRLHANQDSNKDNPRHTLGMVDWEMFMRYEYLGGNINRVTAEDWGRTVLQTYWAEMERRPQLRLFHSRLSADMAFNKLASMSGFLQDYHALRMNLAH